MSRLWFWMKALAVAIVLLFTISIIEDDHLILSLPQTTDGGTYSHSAEAITNRHGTSNTWTDMLDDWSSSTSTSLWNIWIPFNSTFSDWSDWYSGFDDDDSDGSNASSLFLWTPISFKPEVSIVVDFTSESDALLNGGSDWMSRIAFAKMLQIEAKRIYGVETRIVVVGPTPWGDDCFPNVENEITIVSDSSELKVAELEQELWLGEKARLLEASPGVWQDGLYVLQQHYRSKSARYASEISVPHLRVESMTPGLTEWKYLPELLDLLRVDPMCCTLPLTESSAPVVNLDSRLPLQTDPLVQILEETHSPSLVVVGTSTDNADRSESLLLKLSGYEVQFVSQEDSPGYSEAAKYCFLQRAGFALLGFIDSPLSVWAAMANHEAQILRLVDVDTNDASRLDTVTYPDEDPRSRIQIQALTPP